MCLYLYFISPCMTADTNTRQKELLFDCTEININIKH